MEHGSKKKGITLAVKVESAATTTNPCELEIWLDTETRFVGGESFGLSGDKKLQGSRRWHAAEVGRREERKRDSGGEADIILVIRVNTEAAGGWSSGILKRQQLKNIFAPNLVSKLGLIGTITAHLRPNMKVVN